MSVPFAPHSPNWNKLEDKVGCYGVFDGRVINKMTDEQYEELYNELIKSSTEFLGVESELDGGTWASDFFCGKVLILYFLAKRESKDELPAQE